MTEDQDTVAVAERVKPRQAGRRTWDHVYYFMPIVLSFLFGALWYGLNAAFVYGSLTQRIDGKFELLNYRLEQLERAQREGHPR